MATVYPIRRTLSSHVALKNEWINQTSPKIFTRGDFFEYDVGIWSPRPEHLIKQEVLEMLEARAKNQVNAALLSSVFTLGKAAVGIDSSILDGKPNLLRCENGTLELNTRTLRPHSKDDFLTSGVNFNYDPNALALTWEKYLARLEKVLSVEIVMFLQEFAGLCVTTNMEYEIAVWLHGVPGSGRSTFIEGLSHALKDRTMRLSLASLERSQFALCRLPGKTLVVATEQPAGMLQSTYALNQMISGDTITVERKYHDEQEIKPVCKLLWAMNDLPEIDSPNNGIFRRLQTIEFPVMPLCDRDPKVKEQIFRESAGLLNWALVGLDRLNLRGALLIPQQITDANAVFQQANDAEGTFVEEMMRTGSNMEIISSDLYKHYMEWCSQTHHRAKSSTKVAQDWKRLGFKQIKRKNGTYWAGVGW